jgi:hypothetical protein
MVVIPKADNIVKAQDENSIECGFNLDFSTISQGGSLELDFTLTPNFSGHISSFLLEIELSSSKLNLHSITNYLSLSSNELQFYQSSNKANVFYLSDSEGFGLDSGVNKKIFSIKFKPDSDALGDYSIKASLTQTISKDVPNVSIINKTQTLPISIHSYTPVDCRLKSLICNQGELEPCFDPDLHEYKLYVPAEVSEVLFSAEAIDSESTAIKVSRKTLQKAGSTTEITINVKSNSKESLEYKVNVQRSEDKDELNQGSKAASKLSKTSEKTTTSKYSKGVDLDESYQTLTLNKNQDSLLDNPQAIAGAVISVAVVLVLAVIFAIWQHKKSKKDDCEIGEE